MTAPDKVKEELETIFGVNFRYLHANSMHILHKYGKPHAVIQWGDVGDGFHLDIYPTETAKAVYSTPIGTTEPFDSVVRNLQRYGLKVVGYEQKKLF